MRLALPALLLAGLALAACASDGTAGPSQVRLQKLAADCEARGGILTPSGAPLTGRPEVDNVCRITGIPARP